MANRECIYYLQTQDSFNHRRIADKENWGNVGLCSYVIDNPALKGLKDGACTPEDQLHFSDYGRAGYSYQGTEPPQQPDEETLQTIRCPLVSIEQARRNRR